MVDIALAFIIAGVAVNGILSGASLAQPIKQLPARRRIGAVGFSVYSRASDLGNGIAWYAFLGIGGALLAIVAAVLVFFNYSGIPYALPVYLAVLLSVLHSLVTALAAPTNFRRRDHEADEASLSSIFDRFARLQALRATLQVLTFGSLLWVLVAYSQ